MAELPDRVRRRLDEIFGEVLPSVTRDERGEPAPEPDPDRDDARLRADRPPHHESRELP